MCYFEYQALLFTTAIKIEKLATKYNYIAVQCSLSCHGQETAKRLFSLRVKLPPAYLFTRHGGGWTLFFIMLNVNQESCEYQFPQPFV